jgi:hypothetical protein
MRFLQHVAVISAFAVIAAAIVFARPQHKAAAPVATSLGDQIVTSQK